MSATSGPPIGPVLGQYAIPISAFCADFNERSRRYNEGVYVFVTLYNYADGSYDFDMYVHVSSMLIKRAACLTRGFGVLGSHKRGALITAYQLFEAVGAKCAIDGYTDYYFSGESFFASGVGTAKAMGLHFVW
jgi:large subunit ribosomal protein L11